MTMTTNLNHDDDLEQMLIPGQGIAPEQPPITSESEAIAANQRSNIPDYAMFRSAATDDWTELVEGDDFAEYLVSLVPQCVMLPRGDFQLPIVLSYLMLPSALCRHVPILFSHGSPGTGKSELAKLACLIHGIRPIGSNSTPTSLRNAIMSNRFGEPVEGQYYEREKHAVLAWEDVNPQEMRKHEGALFNLLKLGIDRSATIQIASKDGKNLEFYPFSPKYISSIHPIYAEYDFRELIRRVLVVQHKRFDNWVNSDYSHAYEGMKPHDLIDLETYDWDGLQNEFQKYWSDLGRLEHWVSVQKYLSKKKGHGIEKPLWKISKDIIACGVVCGFWNAEVEAIDHMRDYWQWHKENVESQASALQKVLAAFIESSCSDIEKRNQICRESGALNLIQPLEVNPKELKDYVSRAMGNGDIELGTSYREVNSAMLNLGWKLNLNTQGQSRWMKSSG